MFDRRLHYFFLLIIAIVTVAYLLMPSHVGHDTVGDHGPIGLQLIVDGLTEPVLIAEAPDSSGRLFIVEKGGLIKLLVNGRLLDKPFADLSSAVSRASEQGLLGLAFHPDFRNNGRLFVDYTDLNGDTRIDEIIADPPSSDSVNVENRRAVLFYPQPFDNHNGGQLLFGPDGYLYVPSGDGGSAGDPKKNAQNLQSLLGKILRIDVNQNSSNSFGSGPSYGIPADNPFAEKAGEAEKAAALPEIWAYGMRNPWRCTFDTAPPHRFICADVGQNKIEEIDLIERGGNYGWPMYEGKSCYQPPCDPAGKIMPVSIYDHDSGISVTGGYVYRGSVLSALRGRYLFGDYGSGTLWSIPADQLKNGDFIEPVKLLQTGASISSFGQDSSGELYIVDFSGKIFRLVAALPK